MYSNAQDVIDFTGVTPEDLGFEDQPSRLTDMIEEWLEQVTDLINTEIDRDYDDDPPAGIQNVALRAAANMVGYAIQRRTSSTVKIDDFNIRLIEDRIMTPSIRSDLRRYSRRNTISMFLAGPLYPVIEDDE